jgi:hypothetical protein
MLKTTYPTKTLAQGCEYKPASHTNIQQTWRKFGWMPLAELAEKEAPKFAYSWGREPSEKGACNA